MGRDHMGTRYPEIIIIVGCAHSGTGYLARQLGKSMDIGFPPEPKFVVPMYRRLHRFGNLGEPTNLCRLVQAIHQYSKAFKLLPRWFPGISSCPEEILERVQAPTYTSILYAVFQLLAEKRGRSRLGYKDPSDVFYLPLLANLMPTARFIHIVRDGRDVALSLLKSIWGSTNLYCGCRYWARAVSTARRDGANLGKRYFELRLEDLVLNTEHTAGQLGMFVNQGCNQDQMQNLIDGINKTKMLDRSEVWRRRMDVSQRYLCEVAAGEVLRACGYATEFEDRTSISPLKAGYYFTADFVLRARNRLNRLLPRSVPA
jgi:hypothetical protein